MDGFGFSFDGSWHEGRVILKRDWVLEFNEESGEQFGSDFASLLLGNHMVPEADPQFKCLVLLRQGHASHEDPTTFFIGVGHCFVLEISNNVGVFQCMNRLRV